MFEDLKKITELSSITGNNKFYEAFFKKEDIIKIIRELKDNDLYSFDQLIDITAIDYPSKEEELKIMQRMSDLNFKNSTKTILNKKDISAVQNEINKVSISESIEKYIIEIVNATRKPSSINLNDLDEYISFGASPRASINLSLASKANAFLSNRDYVMPDDIKEIAHDVLNHRIILNYEAEAEGIIPNMIIKKILDKVEINS